MKEKEMVKRLGELIGYGNMMHLASQCWQEMLIEKYGSPVGAFTVGPCVGDEGGRIVANTAEDEREVYPACSRCDLYLENGDDWREQASKLVDAYIKRVKEYQNQIAIGKIEEYKCEFPNSYDCHEVADDIIDWLQSENK